MASRTIVSKRFLRRLPALLIIVITLSTALGCATVPYSYGRQADYIPPTDTEEALSVEQGRPNRFIDGIGWIFGIPARIILWDRRVSNHEISDDTRTAVKTYLTRNELTSVKVRLNQYAPSDELYRTVHNDAVGVGWRYTAGLLTWLFYTLLPQRIIGIDNYNPFSNTINLYSDVPAIALHEAAHARDVAGREYKGTYAVAYFIPFVPLYVESLASSDALGYLRADGTVGEQKEGYKVLYPAYGTYVGASVAPFLASPWSLLAPAIGAIPGHIAGRSKASEITEDGYNLNGTNDSE
jgi:hypothetical protein